MAATPGEATLARGAVGSSRPRWGFARREAMWGYLFISPWIAGFLLFTLIPMAAALVFSLTDFDLRKPDAIHFIGLRNYERLLVDHGVQSSLLTTIRYILITVPLNLVFSLAVATLLNSPQVAGRSAFRTLFYMPIQIPLVAATLIWAGVLNGSSGWVNQALGAVGITGPDWIGDSGWVLVTLALIGLWSCGNMMLIFIAGLQSVPSELYDAARVDGAGRWATFTRVTVPLITPVIFYNVLISLVTSFQVFIQPYVLKNGIPDDATNLFNVNLYREAFSFNQMGYASALAWVLFGVILVVTLVLFWSSRRWVYYAAER
ncbi:MAG TPA: sugar ABC transporter permease [Candidatus Polarisedimenticolia bacterium]|nr:sugar ABC transporter permease [Candidatus Polarisedimenticolia bacterium]